MSSPSLKVLLRHPLECFELNVALEIPQGITVLTGPSGAGKSVTLRLIAGLMKPAQGKISFGETRLFESGPNGVWVPPQQRRMGFVFQNHALFPHLSVQENLLYGARNPARNGARNGAKNDAEKAVREMIARFQLHGLEDRSTDRISGGQRQRVALARALLARPQVLLLDEPFASLDAKTHALAREELHAITREMKIPVLLVTHHQEDAEQLGSSTYMIENGTIENGPIKKGPLTTGDRTRI